jgi:hypothetical protein
MNFIGREFPAMRPRFEKLYATANAPAAYRKEAQAMVHVLQSRYGLAKREQAAALDHAGESVPDEIAPDDTQVAFAWD